MIFLYIRWKMYNRVNESLLNKSNFLFIKGNIKYTIRLNYPNLWKKNCLQVINLFLKHEALKSLQSISQPHLPRDEEILKQVIIITQCFCYLRMQWNSWRCVSDLKMTTLITGNGFRETQGKNPYWPHYCLTPIDSCHSNCDIT